MSDPVIRTDSGKTMVQNLYKCIYFLEDKLHQPMQSYCTRRFGCQGKKQNETNKTFSKKSYLVFLYGQNCGLYMNERDVFIGKTDSVKG